MAAKYFDVDGVATLVQHRGPTTLPGDPPDTGNGAAVVCMHDAGGNGNGFAALLDELVDGHSPISYDQPGHGRSASLDSLGDMSLMADHARTLVDALAVEHPVLVGEGLGAAVAIEAAVGDPSWPAALVLCGGAASSFDVDDEVEKLSLITAGRARREFDRTGYSPDTPREVYQRAFGEWVKTDPRVTLGDRRAQAAWDRTDDLGSITCPVLVVVGEHEEAPYREAATALAEAIPSGTLVDLAGAGRRGVIEQPAGLAAAIDGFLGEARS